MWNPPADLSPEAIAWIEAQAAITSARVASRLQAQIDRAEDRVSGVFLALAHMLPHLIKDNREMRHSLCRSWGAVSEELRQIECYGKTPNPGETMELLDARDMLFQVMDQLGLWGDALQPAVPPRKVPRRAA